MCKFVLAARKESVTDTNISRVKLYFRESNQLLRCTHVSGRN